MVATPDSTSISKVHPKLNSKIENLIKKVEDKTSNYDSKASKDAYSQPNLEKIGYFDMTMRYASFGDKMIFALACFGMIFYGCLRPLFSVLYGKVAGGAG